MTQGEACIDYSDPSGDTCVGAPLRREDETFIALEFQLPTFPANTIATNVVLSAVIDPMDDSNVGTTLGTVQLIANFGDNLRDGPAQANEAVFGSELNSQPPTPAPAAGMPVAFELDGRHLRSGETVWLGVVGESEPAIYLTRNTAKLSFTLIENNLPPESFVDDTQIAGGVRIIYPTFSGCRNIDAQDATRNECQLGALKLDESPDVVHSYLHFSIPDPPLGQSLSSAELSVHTIYGYGARGGGAGELSRVQPFTPDSLNQPGAANTPSVIAPASDPPSTSIGTYEQDIHTLFAGSADPGELYLQLAPSERDAVWLYSHDAPLVESDNRPHLILRYQ
jgi:hypothetical protein